MAKDEKTKVIRLTTPKGIAKYPWLSKADTKFKKEGEYRLSLLIPGGEAINLVEQLNALVDAQYEKTLTTLAKPNDKNKIKKKYPYSDEVDSEGQNTGNIEFKFKLPALITLKDGGTLTLKPDLFDALGKPLPKDVVIFGGSLVKVNFSPRPYYVASSKETGVSLRLNAVQVIELVSGGRSADAYGFSIEEGGYTGEVVDTTPDTANDAQDF